MGSVSSALSSAREVCATSIDFAAVERAAARLAPYIVQTPLLQSEQLDRLSNHDLFFKCESLQRTGSFKLRGAVNALLSLGPEAVQCGVLTASSGNFALALAWAAQRHGVEAHVVMPSDTSAVKRAAVDALGAEVHVCRPDLADRERVRLKVGAETGAIYVLDTLDVIAGHGTIALELLNEIPDLDAIVVPIGGGGLISGLAVAAKTLRPGIQVIGAEPTGASDAARSKELGRLVHEPHPRTVADGLRVGLSETTWPFVRDLVDEIVLVDDEATVSAMGSVWEGLRLVVEPSAAVAAAAALAPAFQSRADCRHVAVVLTGGNVDPHMIPRAVS